jgi:hypothetical protein
MRSAPPPPPDNRLDQHDGAMIGKREKISLSIAISGPRPLPLSNQHLYKEINAKLSIINLAFMIKIQKQDVALSNSAAGSLKPLRNSAAGGPAKPCSSI